MSSESVVAVPPFAFSPSQLLLDVVDPLYAATMRTNRAVRPPARLDNGVCRFLIAKVLGGQNG